MRQLTIISTNDRHSNFLDIPYDPVNPAVPGSGTVGGLARVATVVKEIRSKQGDTLLLDAGDFIDGTIFIAGQNGAADFNMMKKMGYDAACVGNHELAMGPGGFALMIQQALKGSDGIIPPLLCANLQFSNTDADDALEVLYGREGEPGKYIFPYIVRTTESGIKVGIFGFLGANVFMPEASPVKVYVDYTEIQSLVNHLREKEGVHAVICLAHASLSVTDDGSVTGEAAALARNVYGIDLICAGHSHIKASAVVQCEVPGSNWKTEIIEAGDEAKAIGLVILPINGNSVDHEQVVRKVIDVDDSIQPSSSIIAEITSLISDVEDNYLKNFPPLKGGRLFDVLAEVNFTYGWLNAMNLVSDAMRHASGSDVALVTKGGDSANLYPNRKGKITVYEAFRALPHNMGRDGLHGSALYKFYLYAEEVKTILEFTTCNLGLTNRDFFIMPSGIRLVYDTTPRRARTGDGYIIKMYFVSPDEKTETLVFDRTNSDWNANGGWMSAPGTTGAAGDPRQLISVSTTILTLMGLKHVAAEYGYDLWPRDRGGMQVRWENISDLDQFLVTATEGGLTYEYKAWYSVARFIDSFGGILPSRYDDDINNVNSVGPAFRRVWDVAEYGMP